MKKIASLILSGLLLVPGLALAAPGGFGGHMMASTTPGSTMGQRMGFYHSASSRPHWASVSGTVSAVSGEIISLTGSNGTPYSVDATGARIVRKYGAVMQITDIQGGDNLSVYGTATGTSITAKTIRDNSQQQRNASFSGSVLSVSGSSFVLSTHNRGDQTVTTDSATKFKENGVSSPGLTNVTVGENAEVSGVWDSTASTVAASLVVIVVKTGTITGTLTGVSGAILTITTSSTNPVTYTVDASSVKKVDRRYGASTDLGALQTGDTLQVRGVINGTGIIASTVRDMSLQARYGTFTGTIGALGGDGNSFTLQSKERGSQTVNTTASTIFRLGSVAGNYASLAAGQTVTVSGVWDRTNSNVTVSRVTIKVSRSLIVGALTNISGTTLIITNASGTPYTIDASKARVYYKGYHKGDVSILQVNDPVRAYGQIVSGSTNMAASFVQDMSQTYVKPAAGSPNQSAGTPATTGR